MKKMIILFGIVALTATFGFSLVSCGGDDGGGGGDSWSNWQDIGVGYLAGSYGSLTLKGNFTRDSITVEVQNGTPTRFSVYKGQTHYVSGTSSTVKFRYSPSTITWTQTGGNPVTVTFTD